MTWGDKLMMHRPKEGHLWASLAVGGNAADHDDLLAAGTDAAGGQREGHGEGRVVL
jgi:hypothetical protein